MFTNLGGNLTPNKPKVPYRKSEKQQTFATLSMCLVTCHLPYEHSFPAPRGWAFTNEGNTCHRDPLFLLPGLPLTSLPEIFIVLCWSWKTSPIEDCKIFPKVQALIPGSSPRPAQWSRLRCGSQACGTWQCPWGPRGCAQAQWFGVTLLPSMAQVSVSLVLWSWWVAPKLRSLKGAIPQSFSKQKDVFDS